MIIKENRVWILTDEKHGLIGAGTPRNRYIRLIDYGGRTLTYTTEGRARANCTRNIGFYTGVGVEEYLLREYGITPSGSKFLMWSDYYHIMAPVEVRVTMELWDTKPADVG